MLESVFQDIELDEDGDLHFPMESTRVFIHVFVTHGGQTAVNIYSPINLDVPRSDELFRFLATESDVALFGHLSAREREDGRVDVMFSHRILGDFLQEEELQGVVATIASTADAIDGQIKERFGGRLLREVEEGLPPADAPSSGDTPTTGYL